MTTNYKTHFALAKYPELNVTGRVPRKPREFVGSGGFGDIYKGTLACICTAADGVEDGNDGELRAVAMKFIRQAL